MIIAIAAAEIAFWICLALGLILRYPLGRPRAGLALLTAIPAIDALLLIAVAIDLAGGAEAGQSHALAAIYLSVSLVFGRSLIEWADVRFAHRFAGGPPRPRPTGGAERTRLERRGWLRHAAAWCIGCALLLLMALAVGDPERTTALTGTAQAWTVILAIDAAFSLPARGGERHGGSLRR